MTLIQVRNQVLNRFTQSDTLTVEDFAAIELAEDVRDRRDQVLRAVLADLEEIGMVRGLQPNGLSETDAKPDMWVLTNPIGAAGQQVHLSLSTSLEMAEEINAYNDAYERGWPDADALNMGEHNILMLLAIITHLRGTEPGEFGGEPPIDPSRN